MVRIATLVRAAAGLGHDRLRAQSWNDSHLLAVCDGAGGAPGAADAADYIIDSVFLSNHPPPRTST